MVNFRINDTRQIPPIPIHRGLVEDADESAPVGESVYLFV